MRVTPEQVDQLLHPMIDPGAKRDVMAKGLPASPGAAVGKVVFTANDAQLEADKGEKVILVRIETSPEDIHGMNAAQGILTARGGMTSHAAVVARGMGKPCVAGTRIRVWDIYVHHEVRGMTPDEIVAQYTELSLADVHAAMAYYWDNREAIDKQMKDADEFVDQLKAATGPGPLERRLRGMDSGSDPVSS